LLTTERTPTLNIEWGQINPKAGGACNIDSGQNAPKATQGLKDQDYTEVYRGLRLTEVYRGPGLTEVYRGPGLH